MIKDLRDKIANFDDFFRPIRSYFYWEKHCYDIPACFALRSTFDALDSIDQLTAKFEDLTATLDRLDALQPKLVALIPPQIASQQTNRDLTLASYATLSGIYAQTRPRSTTRRRWGGPLTPRRTTTPSTCRPRFSTTPTSSAG